MGGSIDCWTGLERVKMSERTINVNAEWYETVTAELKAKNKHITELEAKRDQWRIAGEFWHKKHTALVDGLWELAEKKQYGDIVSRHFAAELLALLGKEKDDD